MSFFAEFIRNPTKDAAVTPSNRAPALVATTTAPPADSPVVELGLDTGSFTEAIQRRLTGRGRRIAVVPADEISGRCRRSREIAHANVVASGLPWSAFAVRRQRDGLARVASALPPDGVFTTCPRAHPMGPAGPVLAALPAIAVRRIGRQPGGEGEPATRSGLGLLSSE